ncbi:MAG: RIP metalloprotease RseP [Bacteroidetes bacterium]|nr:RIP metalloprotease RseP [Bacteroidota bacterium]
MENIIYILRVAGLLIAGLSVLVIIHEFGHYLPARLFGMRVEKFYLFFDWPRKLFSFKKGDTEYGVGMIPLGGYVKISGIVDESMDTGQLKEAPKPWEFRSKPVWQRAIVMAGGVIMNVLLGMLIFTWIFAVYGEEKLANRAETQIYVRPGSVGDSLGFRSGDRILSFMGEPVPFLDEVMNPKVLLEDKPVFVVKRDGQEVTIHIPSDFINKFAEMKDPEKAMLFAPLLSSTVRVDDKEGKLAREMGLQTGDRILTLNDREMGSFNAFSEQLSAAKQKLEGDAKLSVTLTYTRKGIDSTFTVTTQLGRKDVLGLAPLDTIAVDYITYGFFQSFAKGTSYAFGTLAQNIKGLRKVFVGDADVTKSLSGPVGIAKMWDKATTKAGFRGFLEMMGLLSMVLALMNILPIPALDGGHLVFLGIEAIIRREPSLKVRMIAQQVGMALLLLLMAFVIVNDFLK